MYYKCILHLYIYYICTLIYIQNARKYNTIEELRFILERRENFWILNFGTLYPDTLNQ